MVSANSQQLTNDAPTDDNQVNVSRDTFDENAQQKIDDILKSNEQLLSQNAQLIAQVEELKKANTELATRSKGEEPKSIEENLHDLFSKR